MLCELVAGRFMVILSFSCLGRFCKVNLHTVDGGFNNVRHGGAGKVRKLSQCGVENNTFKLFFEGQLTVNILPAACAVYLTVQI